MQHSQPLWKIVWKVFKKLKIELPYDPGIPLLGIYPDKNIIQKDTRTRVLSGTIHSIKTRKQPKCSSTDEWMKMQYMYTMSYYPVMEENKIMPLGATCMYLEIIILMKSVRKRKTHAIRFHLYVESNTWHRDAADGPVAETPHPRHREPKLRPCSGGSPS